MAEFKSIIYSGYDTNQNYIEIALTTDCEIKIYVNYCEAKIVGICRDVNILNNYKTIKFTYKKPWNNETMHTVIDQSYIGAPVAYAICNDRKYKLIRKPNDHCYEITVQKKYDPYKTQKENGDGDYILATETKPITLLDTSYDEVLRCYYDLEKNDPYKTQKEAYRLAVNSVYGMNGEGGHTTMNTDGYSISSVYYDDLAKSLARYFPTTTAKSKAADMVKKVIFNPPATIVFWRNGDKTVVKCQEGDVFDEETGFLMAYFKYNMGNKGKANSILHYICENAEGHVENRFSSSIDFASFEPVTFEFKVDGLSEKLEGILSKKEPDNED